MHSSRYHLIITLSLTDRHDWRDTQGKWPLARNPDRSWWHRHTSLKLFWPQPMASWTTGLSYLVFNLQILGLKESTLLLKNIYMRREGSYHIEQCGKGWNIQRYSAWLLFWPFNKLNGQIVEKCAAITCERPEDSCRASIGFKIKEKNLLTLLQQSLDLSQVGVVPFFLFIH